MRLFVIVAALAALAGCATLGEGGDQTINVATIPPGAKCVMERDGVTIAALDPTPASVRIEKSKHDISMTCSKEGFNDAGALIRSEFERDAAGNFMTGGIGVVVDAGTGAMNRYEDEIVVKLEENSFFDDEINRVQRAAMDEIVQTARNCPPHRTDECRPEIEQIRRGLERRVEDVERRRIEARGGAYQAQANSNL